MYKKLFTLLMALSTPFLMAEQADIDMKESLKEGNYRIVPLISSNPTSGTGVGASVSYLYSLDPDSSPSQLLTGAQYTNTKSYSIFAKNDAYLYDDKFRSLSIISIAHNKSQLDLPADFSVPGAGTPATTEDDARFDVDIIFVMQMALYEFKEHFFAGGHIFYVNLNFSNPNAAGEQFLKINGIRNDSRATLGLDFSYDTRSKKEKYFPRNAEWIMFQANHTPTFLGSEESYSAATINARIYRPGFNEDDVWANQFFGFYTTENTPDGALPALGSRKILRGFAIGQYKARFMTAAQTEYRYQIPDTKFRAVAFIGGAQLSGGSKGNAGGNRDSNNGFYYSGGVGLRYAIQQKAGVDMHLDITTNNDGEQSIYVGVNQAF